jgi:predicted amino acid dehydrogenase
MVEDRPLAKKRILQTIRLAEKYGAEVVGLGGITSSVTQGGLELVEEARAGLVTGRALTPVIVSDFAISALNVAGRDPAKEALAVVGAAGAIGSSSAVLLAREGLSKILLIDVERKLPLLDQVIARIKTANPAATVEVGADISRIREAGLIVTATSAPEALILSADVSPGTIIVDDAQPTDVHPEVLERSDVVVLTAGVIKTPGIRSHFPMSLSHPEENFSCFGEVVTLASHYRHDDFSVGYIKDEEIEEIKKLSLDLGITRGNFQNHKRSYTDEEMRQIAGAKS